MKSSIVIAILIISSVACFAQTSIIKDSKEKLFIDLDKAKKGAEYNFHFSGMYKSVKIIPLETNKTCLIGIINKIVVNDPYIFVLDSEIAHSLYAFDMEGRFIRKFGNIGQGPGEYNRIFDFTIDRNNKIVFILDCNYGKINKYNIENGKFIQSIPYRHIDWGRGLHIVCVDGVLYSDINFSQHSQNNYLLYSIDIASGNDINHFLNVMEYNKGFSNISGGSRNPYRPFFTRQNGDAIFVQSFMNHVIEITKDGVFSLFEFKGKDLLTTEEAKKVNEIYEIRGGLVESFQINKYLFINSYMEKNDLIIIEMGKGMSVHRIVINKKTKEVSFNESFYNDMLYKNEAGGISPRFMFTDHNGVYYTTSGFRSTGASEIRKLANEGKLSPDAIGLEKIKDLEDDDNPIIIFYEYKD